MDKKLLKSSSNKMFDGVCAGLGDYFKVDPTIVRLLFVLATFFTGGSFALVYLVLMIVVPRDSDVIV